MQHEQLNGEVKKILSDYLLRQKLRRTPERFAILEEIYSNEGHFDVDSLYRRMKGKKMHISRATIYNTVEHLMACDLITRHQFGKNTAQYERAYTYKQHDHLICTDCEHVFEFCDPRIQQIQNMMGQLLKFSITSHRLNLYGRCNTLKDTGTCVNKQKHQTHSP